MQTLVRSLRPLLRMHRDVGRRLLGFPVLFVLLAVSLAGTAYGQEHAVSGTVTDAERGEPLPGVNVRVVDTETGTATNAEGEYSLMAPSEDATLRFSFVGYENQTINIEGRSTVDVALSPTTLTGGEVVVTGYTEERRADLTGAVQVVDSEDLQQISEGQITDQLQGNAAGVSVISSGQPGQDPQIRIRGINTFGDNTPLFVVDGVTTRSIGDLNPSDIENIQVLKDASSASIYGARAANGVVVIETKKGEGDISVSLNTYTGISQQPDTDPWNMIDPQGRANLKLLAQCNSGITPSDPQYEFPNGCGGEAVLPDYILPEGASEDDVNEDNYFVIPEYTDANPAEFTQIVRANKQGTNWFDEITERGTVTKTDFTVSGGGDTGSYLLGVGYLSEEGTVMRTFLERYSLRANATYDVTDNIRVGENLSYTAEENRLDDELTEGSAIGMAMRQRTIVPVRDIEGNFAGSRGDGLGNPENPVAMRYRTRNDESLDKRLFGNMFAEVDFLTDFRFRTSIGGDISSGFGKFFAFPTYENSENNDRNALTENAYNSYEWTWSNTLNFERTFAESHNVSALAGVEWQRNDWRFEQSVVEDYFSFDPTFTTLDNGSGTTNASSERVVRALASQFGKVDYNYERRYFLSGTVRRDGSSVFLENKYGIFPAASAGWRISEEPFMEEGLPWLTDLKLRASWGIMGNQLNVPPNNAYTLFGSLTYGYDIGGTNSSPQQGFEPNRVGAPQARWEEQENRNVGIDVAVLDGQLEFTIDYYQKIVEDLLFDPELPAPAGQVTQPFVNVGSMENTGVDASVRGQTEISDLQIDASLNVTSYNNEITSVSGTQDNFQEEARRFNDGSITRNEVGHEMSSYFGYDVVGFFGEDDFDGDGNLVDGIPDQTDAAPGRFRYKDVDGNGEITPDDRTFLGSPNPDFTAGLNLRLNYNNWDLSMALYGSQGAEIWNQTKWWTHFFSGFNGAKSEAALEDSWRPGEDNSNATVPIQETERTFSTNGVPNSYFVEDADYLRVRNLQLGYALPPELIGQIGAKSLRIYVKASNLLTVTNYSNPEPEIGGSDAEDVTSFGIDEGAYPTPRKYLVGVNLTF